MNTQFNISLGPDGADEDQLMARLRELMELRQALNETSILAITDPDGVITKVNDKFCEISGYSHEELIGRTHRLIRSNHHDQAFFRQLWQTIRAGQIWRGEICNRAKNGRIYWVDTTIIPFTGPQGEILRYLALRHEITPHKDALAHLAEREHELTAIFDSTADGILMADTQGRIRRCNLAASRIFAICPVSALNTPLHVLLPSLQPAAAADLHSAIIDAADAQGRPLHLDVYARAIHHHGQHLTIYFIRNVTDQLAA